MSLTSQATIHSDYLSSRRPAQSIKRRPAKGRASVNKQIDLEVKRCRSRIEEDRKQREGSP